MFNRPIVRDDVVNRSAQKSRGRKEVLRSHDNCSSNSKGKVLLFLKLTTLD